MAYTIDPPYGSTILSKDNASVDFPTSRLIMINSSESEKLTRTCTADLSREISALMDNTLNEISSYHSYFFGATDYKRYLMQHRW